MTLNSESLTDRENPRLSRNARIAGSMLIAAAIGIALSRLPSYAVALTFTGIATLYALKLRRHD